MRLVATALFPLMCVFGAADARAQMPTVDPSESEYGTVGQPPIEEPAPATAPAATGADNGAKGESGDSRFYGDYLEGDDLESDVDDFKVEVHGEGAVPAAHTVVKGDTLWDISGTYFNNPWEWPKVWALNPEITNPHWIYPGNVVKLRGQAAGPVAAPVAPEGEGGAAEMPVAAAQRTTARYALRQMAYVDLGDLQEAGKIVGSADEKELLATGDSVYLSYEGEPPKQGARYAIYLPEKTIKSPPGKKGKDIGAYVRVVGELQVTFVKDDKRARAIILDSVDAIERKMLVGPITLRFDRVEPVVNKAQLDGLIVGQFDQDQLIGARQAVIIDQGKSSGVEGGNRFSVIRRGDAYGKPTDSTMNVGQDDDRYPARVIGEILVVQVGESSSLGFVTVSLQEFGIGDHVTMRKGQ